jgi:hypothetical protein
VSCMSRNFASWLLLACFLPLSSPAQSNPPLCRTFSSESQASDVDLRLALANGKSVYREGEIIPLKLAFSARANQKYTADTSTYDRSGRLGMEIFCLSPDSGRDPLADYYNSGIFTAFIGGGLFAGYRVLEPVPYVVEKELNEWTSLPPGRYVLRVASRLIGSAKQGEMVTWSNSIEFQIVAATPEWQAAQIAEATLVLDAKYPKLTEDEFDGIVHGERVLRFLGSEGATRELAKRFWFHDRGPRPHHAPGVGYPESEGLLEDLERMYWNFEAGLIGSPHRSIAIEELTSAINDGQHRATRAMVETLALLEIQAQTQYGLPPRDSMPADEWERLRVAKRAAYDKKVSELWDRVSSEHGTR